MVGRSHTTMKLRMREMPTCETGQRGGGIVSKVFRGTAQHEAEDEGEAGADLRGRAARRAAWGWRRGVLREEMANSREG
jgi:hypothetical protein